MLFIILVFLAAFSIEGIGTYVSVVGLSALFAANPVVIILAVALDFGKIVSVSFLYKYWSMVNGIMKTYMTVAAAVLVLITSTGAFGFLSGEFQKAISTTGQQGIKITALEEEKGRLQKRKEEIDSQIAKLPDSNVRGRTQLIKQFGPEVNRLNDRLADIDKQLPDLKVQNIDKEIHVGPVIYVAKAFNTTPEEAVKWVILTIIFVFDPLAIALLIAGNFLLALRKQEKQARLPSIGRLPDAPLIVDPDPPMNEPPVDYPEHLDMEKIDLENMVAALQSEPSEEEMEFYKSLMPEKTPEEVAEVDETPTQPLQLKKHITVTQQDGRDVISLETEIPKSSLESVNSKLADIAYDVTSNSDQTTKLRAHYNGSLPSGTV